VSQALTPLLATAALVLCVAGVAKLRAPGGAVRALSVIGLPGGPVVIRGLGGAELALGIATVIHPGRAQAAAIAALYAVFAVVALVLTRRDSSCGCFGADERPASVIQSVLSAALAAIALAAVLAPAHGIGWMLARPVVPAAVLVLGVAGAAYAMVIGYTELPAAWGSWSGA
jgi:hypothetical protein